MASAKIATLLIRTLAKPISNQIKTQAKQHEKFRNFCVGLAQGMYRTELNLRTNLLGEPAKHVRPLSETRAIENGANALAEGFLFGVAALLILGETWRSSRSETKRREGVEDRLDELQNKVDELNNALTSISHEYEERWSEERARSEELTRILERIVEVGLRGHWAEFEGTPLMLPRIQLSRLNPPQDTSSPSPALAADSPESSPSPSEADQPRPS